MQLPLLQQSLVPAVFSYGRASLIKAMCSSDDDNMRREAASYLGTLAMRDTQVAADIVTAFRFDPYSETTAWNGGALFIPALNWDKPNGRNLVEHLMRWMLWCDHNRKRNVHNQIQNNLSSIQLMRVAGYEWPSEYDAVGWLTTWKKVVGQQGIEAILIEQGVQKDARYQSLLR